MFAKSVVGGKPYFNFCLPFLDTGTLVLRGSQRKQLASLVWMIGANVPPHALNNKYWSALQSEFGVSLPEVATMWKLLPVLHDIVVADIEAKLAKLSSFVTLLDIWTSLDNRSFLLLRVVGIIPDGSFRFWSVALDLIRFFSRTFATTIAATVEGCVRTHTARCPNVIHAGNISDAGSNVHLAGQLLTSDEDQMNCFNHKLKNVIDDSLGGEVGHCGSAKCASKDIIGLLHIVSLVRSCSEVAALVKDDAGLAAVQDCVTRWDGKYRALARFLELAPAISGLVRSPAHRPLFESLASDLGASCPNKFLSKAYFQRLELLRRFLKPFQKVTLKAQSDNYPTGSCVPKWVSKLSSTCISTTDDPEWFVETKVAFATAIENRLHFFITTPNNYLKAALFNPQFSSKLEDFGVPADVISTAWTEVYLLSC